MAKKFSTPCCTHPDSRETKDESPIWTVEDSGFPFLGITTSNLLQCSINLNVVFSVVDVKGYVADFAMQQENERMDTDKVVIKKYANRRLYDTCNSRYINLEDIAALVRNGKEVQVVDAGTGDDITRVTLTQIIVEDAKGQPAGLPLELLRQLIVTTDHVGQEFIMWYLKSAFDSYQKVHSSLQDRFSQMQSAALSPVQMLKNVLQSVGPEKSGESNPEMDEMRKRIVELEMQLQRSKAGKKRSRKKT